MKRTIVMCWENDSITRETIDEELVSAEEYVKFIDGLALEMGQSRLRSWEYAARQDGEAK